MRSFACAILSLSLSLMVERSRSTTSVLDLPLMSISLSESNPFVTEDAKDNASLVSSFLTVLVPMSTTGLSYTSL